MSRSSRPLFLARRSSSGLLRRSSGRTFCGFSRPRVRRVAAVARPIPPFWLCARPWRSFRPGRLARSAAAAGANFAIWRRSSHAFSGAVLVAGFGSLADACAWACRWAQVCGLPCAMRRCPVSWGVVFAVSVPARPLPAGFSRVAPRGPFGAALVATFGAGLAAAGF